MKIFKKRQFIVAIVSLFMFLLCTVLISFVNVQAIGPNGSSVGFATINEFVLNLIGTHLSLYIITDWLGLVPIICVMFFASLGLFQWIKRKKLLKVDFDILILGIYYVILFAVFLLFEIVVINYRPVLIEGVLEASYPSSTTMLVLCVMSSVIIQIKKRINNIILRRITITLSMIFIVFMIIGRLLSGVHWFTDIIGGTLFSISMINLYSLITKQR